MMVKRSDQVENLERGRAGVVSWHWRENVFPSNEIGVEPSGHSHAEMSSVVEEDGVSDAIRSCREVKDNE